MADIGHAWDGIKSEVNRKRVSERCNAMSTSLRQGSQVVCTIIVVNRDNKPCRIWVLTHAGRGVKRSRRRGILIAGAGCSSIMSIHDTGTSRRHADGERYMALHISPSGITYFPRVGTTFLTPSQYQKFCNMSTANRQISTISELLTNLSIFEPVQTCRASSYCHIWTSDF